jgi:eukaryotic-like serine/threonine-protein kinase
MDGRDQDGWLAMTDAADRLHGALEDRYTIERELGAGGMATVYLAHDLKHDRKVAIKVLRPELSAVIGAERFLREIKTIANLQHPHILGLIDSGDIDGTAYYVMPFVEGESLRDRLNHEKQLPIADALRLATEVAGALDYAHRHGVIHRDIKPENIMLHDGQALVTDFGIALAVSNTGGTRMTETGMSLGTPYYMSPEQAMGEREITARSDVYALGAVTYEMLVGDPPFTGSTAQAIVAKVVTEAPRSMMAQRHTIPPHVEAAVLTALEKLPADRFESASAFADALNKPELMTATVAGRTAAVPARRTGPLVMGLASALVVAAAAAVWSWLGWHRAENVSATWQYVSLGDSARINAATANPLLVLSPDGNSLVFCNAADQNRLWVKQRGQLAPHPLPGTDGASNPAISPDGKWVAFVAGGRLKKVALAGGPPVTLADTAAATFGGVAWMDDNTIIYGVSPYTELRRVPASGGKPERIMFDTTLRGGGIGTPVALPDARGVLYQYCGSACVTQSVGVLDLKTGKSKLLLDNALEAWYLPDGHLLYVTSEGSLMAVPFDLGKLAITGEAVPVMEGIFALTGNGSVPLTWSRSGSLVYFIGSTSSTTTEMMRVGFDGRASIVDSTWSGQFNSMDRSPDGSALAVGDGSANSLDIWIKHLDHGPYTRFTFSNQERRPAWAPDGKRIAFINDSGPEGSVRTRAADGTGTEQVVAGITRRPQELAWSADGKWLLVRTDNTESGGGDIVAVHGNSDTTSLPLAVTPYTELEPAVSPDNHFFAYASNESGQFEVYVRPFPDASVGHWQVSLEGATDPVWSNDGHTLFYRRSDGWIIEADLAPGSTFAVTSRKPLFDASGYIFNGFHQSFVTSADGKGFYFVRTRGGTAGANTQQLVWVDHWFSFLKERLKK